MPFNYMKSLWWFLQVVGTEHRRCMINFWPHLRPFPLWNLIRDRLPSTTQLLGSLDYTNPSTMIRLWFTEGQVRGDPNVIWLLNNTHNEAVWVSKLWTLLRFGFQELSTSNTRETIISVMPFFRNLIKVNLEIILQANGMPSLIPEHFLSSAWTSLCMRGEQQHKQPVVFSQHLCLAFLKPLGRLLTTLGSK